VGIRVWHVARAEYHKDVAEHLRRETEFEDWALVALYYSALHLVDSVLADDPDLPKDERNPRKHSGVKPGQRGRNQLVGKLFPFAPRKAYRSLEDLSRRTRYDCEALKSNDARKAYDLALDQWREVDRYARMMHIARPPIPSEAP